MKIFQYKFSRATIAAICAGLAASAAGFGVTLYQVIRYGIEASMNPAYTVIQYVLMFAVSVALAVILISLLVSSYYAIDGEKKRMITCFGLVKSKYDVGLMDTVVLDRNTDKLSVTFEDSTFIVIVVKEEWYEDFVDELLKVNPSIEFSIKTEEPTDKKGKK